MKCPQCQNEMVQSKAGWLCVACGHIEKAAAEPAPAITQISAGRGSYSKAQTEESATTEASDLPLDENQTGTPADDSAVADPAADEATSKSAGEPKNGASEPATDTSNDDSGTGSDKKADEAENSDATTGEESTETENEKEASGEEEQKAAPETPGASEVAEKSESDTDKSAKDASEPATEEATEAVVADEAEKDVVAGDAEDDKVAGGESQEQEDEKAETDTDGQGTSESTENAVEIKTALEAPAEPTADELKAVETAVAEAHAATSEVEAGENPTSTDAAEAQPPETVTETTVTEPEVESEFKDESVADESSPAPQMQESPEKSEAPESHIGAETESAQFEPEPAPMPESSESEPAPVEAQSPHDEAVMDVAEPVSANEIQEESVKPSRPETSPESDSEPKPEPQPESQSQPEPLETTSETAAPETDPIPDEEPVQPAEPAQTEQPAESEGRRIDGLSAASGAADGSENSAPAAAAQLAPNQKPGAKPPLTPTTHPRPFNAGLAVRITLIILAVIAALAAAYFLLLEPRLALYRYAQRLAHANTQTYTATVSGAGGDYYYDLKLNGKYDTTKAALTANGTVLKTADTTSENIVDAKVVTAGKELYLNAAHLAALSDLYPVRAADGWYKYDASATGALACFIPDKAVLNSIGKLGLDSLPLKSAELVGIESLNGSITVHTRGVIDNARLTETVHAINRRTDGCQMRLPSPSTTLTYDLWRGWKTDKFQLSLVHEGGNLTITLDNRAYGRTLAINTPSNAKNGAEMMAQVMAAQTAATTDSARKDALIKLGVQLENYQSNHKNSYPATAAALAAQPFIEQDPATGRPYKIVPARPAVAGQIQYQLSAACAPGGSIISLKPASKHKYAVSTLLSDGATSFCYSN